jgi:hypothetical protein
MADRSWKSTERIARKPAVADRESNLRARPFRRPQWCDLKRLVLAEFWKQSACQSRAERASSRRQSRWPLFPSRRNQDTSHLRLCRFPGICGTCSRRHPGCPPALSQGSPDRPSSISSARALGVETGAGTASSAWRRRHFSPRDAYFLARGNEPAHASFSICQLQPREGSA